MNQSVDKKFIILTSLFFLSFTLFTSMIVFNKPLTTLIRAKEDFVPSSTNSIMFAWPLSSPADGKTKVNITVFVRNSKNLTLSNKKVTLSSNLGEITEIQPISDKSGKSIFSLTSNQPGIAEIKSIIDNQIEISQKLSIKFE